MLNGFGDTTTNSFSIIGSQQPISGSNDTVVEGSIAKIFFIALFNCHTKYNLKMHRSDNAEMKRNVLPENQIKYLRMF